MESAVNAMTCTVFLSSPGELEAHRQVVRDTIIQLNSTGILSADQSISVTEWPRTIAATTAPYLQAAINQQLTEYDVLLCLLGHRMGTPTPRASSGTEEEFDRAYESHLLSGRPQLLIYFSDIPAKPSDIDPAQLAQVRVFKQKLARLGVLAPNYSSLQELSELLQTGLSYAAKTDKNAYPKLSPTAEQPAPETQESVQSVTLQSRIFNPQWADYLTIPLARYRRKDVVVRWRMETEWPYFRQGFKITESTESVLSAGGVQTSGANLLMHLGRNSIEHEWFVSPYKHGLRMAADRILPGTKNKASANCEVRMSATGRVLLALDGVEIQSDFLLLDGYPQMYLMAWGDEHDFNCHITNIEILA